METLILEECSAEKLFEAKKQLVIWLGEISVEQDELLNQYSQVLGEISKRGLDG